MQRSERRQENWKSHDANKRKNWLLVVDNVTRLSHVHTYQPGPGNQQWVRGQLLITTQDTTSIPLTSSSIQLISVSEGMLPNHASSLLRLFPGVTDDETEKEVAQSLDYQQLALASTAIHVRKVRKGKMASNFGLTDYLKKLGKGQRGKTENSCRDKPKLPQNNDQSNDTRRGRGTLLIRKPNADHPKGTHP